MTITRQQARWGGAIVPLVFVGVLLSGCSGSGPARAETGRAAEAAPPVLPVASFTPRDVPTITLPDFRAVARRVTPSVVTVRSEREMKFRHPDIPGGGSFDFFERFFGHPPDGESFKQRGLGSGVIVSSDGYVLTNNHVVEGVDKVEVVTADGETHQAKVVGTDAKTDVAVLKVQAKGLKPIEIGDSDKVEVGEWVLAVGNPFSEQLGHTVTAGIVSATGRSYLDLAEYEDFIQTDAAINPGNSGGALVNAAGQLIGLNTAIVSRSGGYQGVSFAIPINMARNVMDQLIRSGKVSRGYIGVGIQNVTTDLAESMGLDGTEGALVGQVEKDTPAAKAGLEAGDVIVALNGTPIKDTAQLRNQVASTAPGTKIELGVVREGKRRKIDLVLDELPESVASSGTEREAEAKTAELGLSVQALTPEVAERLGLEGDQGVIVTGVERGSPAEEAGIRGGDLILEVNRRKITTVADYREAISALESDKLVLVYLKRGDSSVFVTIRPK